MKRFIIEDKEIVSGGTGEKFRAAPTRLPDEELRKMVRQAVKSAPVPADLESRLRNLIRK